MQTKYSVNKGFTSNSGAQPLTNLGAARQKYSPRPFTSAEPNRYQKM